MPTIVDGITPSPPARGKICHKTYRFVPLKRAAKTHDKALTWIFISAEKLPRTILIVADEKDGVTFAQDALICVGDCVAGVSKGPVARCELVRMA